MAHLRTGPVVVVGGGLSASRTCVELRKQGFEGTVVLLSDEVSLPYDRPPLSKAVLRGRYEPKPLKVDYEALGIDVRLGVAALSLDPVGQEVSTTAGAVAYSHLVIATGAAPVRLPGSGEQLVLRTREDALGLRNRLVPGTRVAVVGASWIGAEVAHAAVGRGCEVTGIEYHPTPLAEAFGGEVGARFASWWQGAALRAGQSVDAVEPDGVHLDGGDVVPADVVVVGIGVRPSTAWLTGSGLELGPAVAVDEHLRTAQPAISAVGDAAAWWSRRYGRRVSVQHWDDAHSAPAVVAGGLAHPTAPLPVHDPVPYFWSDQFGHRVEYVGLHDASDLAVVDPDVEPGWTVRWQDHTGRTTAFLGVDQSQAVAAARTEMAELTPG